jgi:restriction endonuclease S subunit
MSLVSIEQISEIKHGHSIRDNKIREIEQTLGVKPNDLHLNTIDFSQAKPYYIKKPEQYLIQSGDILLPLKRVESIVLIPEINIKIAAVGEWAILSMDLNLIDLDYFLWYWQHPTTRARQSSTLFQTSNGMRYLKITDLRKFAIHCPPLTQQVEIVRRDREYQNRRALEEALQRKEDTQFSLNLMNNITN